MPGEKKIKIENGDDSQENLSSDSNEELRPQKSDHASAAEGGLNGTGEQDTVKSLEAKLETVTKEGQENYDRLLRVSAEFENYKKRSVRELSDVQKFANQSLVKDLLPIIDNLELALKSATESANNADGCLLDGVELTRKEILKVFEKNNIEQIEAIGKPFDPNFHEAVMREESDDCEENTVINELQKGYLMHDRLIRPAMVVVAMPKSNEKSGS
jgi:molecular chaperone GrpE